MAKSKYSPALFEVINRQRNTGGKLGVPKWWKGLGGSGDQASTEPRREAQAADPQELAPAELQDSSAPGLAESSVVAEPSANPVTEIPAEVPVSPPEIPSVRPWAADAGRPSLFQVIGGRIQLSLSVVQAAVAGGLVLVLMVVGFELGRASSGPAKTGQGNDAIAGILKSKPDGSVLESPANTDAPPVRAGVTANTAAKDETKAAGAKDGGLKPGLNYIVLDRYRRDQLKSAEHTRDWLATSHGIETTVYSTKEKDAFLLITNAGFDFATTSEKEKCEQLLQRIKALGPECRRELMKNELPVYNFKAPMVKKY